MLFLSVVSHFIIMCYSTLTSLTEVFKDSLMTKWPLWQNKSPWTFVKAVGFSLPIVLSLILKVNIQVSWCLSSDHWALIAKTYGSFICYTNMQKPNPSMDNLALPAKSLWSRFFLFLHKQKPNHIKSKIFKKKKLNNCTSTFSPFFPMNFLCWLKSITWHT